MAKKSMVAREAKRARTVEKFAAKRAQLKETIANLNTSDEERWEAQIALQKLPRNASPVRQHRSATAPGFGRGHGFGGAGRHPKRRQPRLADVCAPGENSWETLWRYTRAESHS